MTQGTERLLSEPETHEWQYPVRASRDESFDVVCHSGLLSARDRTLANALRPHVPVLVVSTPSVDRLYGERLRHYLSTNAPRTAISYIVQPCSETRKGIEQVLAVCQRAAEARLARRSQIVCVGGGVSLDITALAATLFRRGIPHIRVPTTLVGMIDAGIGVKNGINFSGSKSLLGAFSAPEACFIDPSFLATLPRRYIQCGLAESIKIAAMCSPELFALLDVLADRLPGDFGVPPDLVEDVVRLSVRWTLSELELNLFERNERFPDTYARKLDFGHTFSPYIEAASHHRILHGEAVAIDMAISVEIAQRLGVLCDASGARILDLLCRVGLPVYWAGVDACAMYSSLESIVRHRDGKLNLVLPAGMGYATFVRDLSELSVALLDDVLQRLSHLPKEHHAEC
jgi:3-dehydroquinate synthase